MEMSLRGGCCWSLVKRNHELGSPKIGFLSTPINHFTSVSVPHHNLIIHPIFLSSSNTQVDVDTTEVQTKETLINDSHLGKTVHVKFRLQKECAFGQHFFLIGEDPNFGLWNPENAVPLNWSDGHVWAVEMDVPIGKSIKYKFILKEGTEGILWQPGPDRTLETWETEKPITVCEDWDDAELQTIIEEEDFPIFPEPLLVAQNLAAPTVTNESVCTVGSRDMMTTSYVEKRVVAETTTETKEMKDNDDISRKDIDVVEHALGHNGGSPSNSKVNPSKKDKGNLASYEGVPVLVPGLTPFAVGDTEEDSSNETPNTSVGDDQATELRLPELDVKEGDVKNVLRLPERNEMSSNDLQGPSHEEQSETPQVAKEQDQPGANSLDTVLDNDLQWGKKTLQNLLNTLGIR